MLKKIKIIIDENTSSDFAHFSTMKNDDSMKTNDNGGLEVFDFINISIYFYCLFFFIITNFNF